MRNLRGTNAGLSRANKGPHLLGWGGLGFEQSAADSTDHNVQFKQNTFIRDGQTMQHRSFATAVLSAGFTLAAIIGNTPSHAETVTFGIDPNFSPRSCVPFGCQGDTRFQQSYSSSAFRGLGLIDAFSFSSGQGSFQQANYTIALSYSAATGGDISTNFNENIGSQRTVVFNSSLSGSIPPIFTIAGFDFLYNPTLGDLLIDITKQGLDQSFSEKGSFSSGYDNRIQIAFSTEATGNDASFVPNYGLTTSFSFSPAVLGTPGPIAGAGLVPLLGLAGAYLFARKRLTA